MDEYKRAKMCGKAVLEYMEAEGKLITHLSNRDKEDAIEKLSELESVYLPEVAMACKIDLENILFKDIDNLYDKIEKNPTEAIYSILDIRNKLKKKLW